MRRAALSLFALAAVAAPARGQPPRTGLPEPVVAPPPEQPRPPAADPVLDGGDGETIEMVDRPPPGAHSSVDRETLERAEHDDVHQVLGQVAGVYLRDEDGFGLRPNIGMRGAAAERSAKVALMEDGVLIAPAPYSAPAAYYFPLITRMSRVDVIKGPAAVIHGPNTVGGAVDLVGEPMAPGRAAYVDAAVGSDGYGKLHARASERWTHGGLSAEYVKLRSEGFKQIDGGGPTGFDKDDLQLWGRLSSAPTARVYHQLDARIGYGDETSNETYTGLSDADFAAAPDRRYAGTQLDQMNWDHWRMRLAHRVEVGADLAIETTAYRHRLDRAWGKVDAFVGQRDFFDLIGNPERGDNPIYFAVLTGQADSTSPEDELLLGTNDRSFVSQGVQSNLAADVDLAGLPHHLVAGVRLHHDRADRRRHEDGYRMMAGQLLRSERPRATVLDTRASTLALALFAQDQVRWRRLTVTAGSRVEIMRPSFFDRQSRRAADDTTAVLIPGGGVELALTRELSALAGVHRGFVPVAPAASIDVRPESSVNYEAGARWRGERGRADLIGFYSDYQNLKGTCTLSSGCAAAMDGDEFNGGRATVIGVEAEAATELPLPRQLSLPLRASYTFTRATFEHAFESEFAAWGDVEAGDHLPYLPTHQASLAAAVVHPRGELGAVSRWHAAARDVAGQGPIAGLERVDALLTIDLAAHARISSWAELYLTCDNVLDERVIVSRRPYGARPNAPRRIALGYKGRF